MNFWRWRSNITPCQNSQIISATNHTNTLVPKTIRRIAVLYHSIEIMCIRCHIGIFFLCRGMKTQLHEKHNVIDTWIFSHIFSLSLGSSVGRAVALKLNFCESRVRIPLKPPRFFTLFSTNIWESRFDSYINQHVFFYFIFKKEKTLLIIHPSIMFQMYQIQSE